MFSTDSHLCELINEKFNIQIDYKLVANYVLKCEKKIFGNLNEDFDNLIEMKHAGLNCFFDFKHYKNLRVENIFFATKSMIGNYFDYHDLLIIDSTFGTIRYFLYFDFVYLNY